MTSRVATVIRCADLVRHVYATMASIERQSRGGGQLVLVTDESTPGPVRDWLTQVARGRDLVSVHAPTSLPGAIRNAGIDATDAPYLMCLDAGDLLDPLCHAACAAVLDDDAGIDLVASPVLLLGPGSARHVAMPPRGDLDELISSTAEVYTASMFRRDTWSALGRFDEHLPSLDDYEFLLRLVQSGRRIAAIEPALFIRPQRADALYRRSWTDQSHVTAMERILETHAAVFGRHPAVALYERQQSLTTLRVVNRQLIDRRTAAMAEVESLRARVEDLRQSLPEHERFAVDLADLRRTTPVSRNWGFERGVPIDRHYIEQFVQQHTADIQGAVLEVLEPLYTRRFGGDRVTRSDVVDLDSSNSGANVISDLRRAANIPSESYDCVILTQTLHLIDDMAAVVAECRRILVPGGVLLATLPCASRLSLEYGPDNDFWRVTEAGARRLFADVFSAEALEVQARGNVLVNAAFLYGLAGHELSPAELDADDPCFPLLVTVRATKTPVAVRAETRRATAVPSLQGRRAAAAAILLYHRVCTPDTDVHGLAVSPDEFQAQIAYVREQYRPLPLEELALAARYDRLPTGAIAVCFDDGYVDNFTNASPILAEHAVPATFFVSTDRLDHDEAYEFWWDTLEWALLSSQAQVPAELHVDLREGQLTFSTRSPDERLAAHSAIYRAVVGMPGEERDAIVDAVRRWRNLPAPADLAHRRMRAHEVVALAARPRHAIGAHSVRHLMLPSQPLTIQLDEVEQSKRTLETLIDRPVVSFAYPFGAFSATTVDAVRIAGLTVAVTCQEETVGPRADPLRLPRLEVTRRDHARFDEWLRQRLGPARHAS